VLSGDLLPSGAVARWQCVAAGGTGQLERRVCHQDGFVWLRIGLRRVREDSNGLPSELLKLRADEQ